MTTATLDAPAPAPALTPTPAAAGPATRISPSIPPRPVAPPIRIDWAVMAQEKYRDVAPLPKIAGCQVVPALTISRNNWLTYPELMRREIDRVVGAAGDARPLIAVDDERKDWRSDTTSTEANDLEEMLGQLHDHAPGARVVLRGPWQATAQPWQVSEEAKRREHQALNNGLESWLRLTGYFCGTLYIPDGATRTEWDWFNLNEFQRVAAGSHLPNPIVMVSPFYRGEWVRGAVPADRMLTLLKMVAASHPTSIAVWGYIGHDRDGGAEAAAAWREVLPGFIAQLRAACGGTGKATAVKGGVGGAGGGAQ